jgi:hypothetical protein
MTTFKVHLFPRSGGEIDELNPFRQSKPSHRARESTGEGEFAAVSGIISIYLFIPLLGKLS